MKDRYLVFYPESSFIQRIKYDRLERVLCFTMGDKEYSFPHTSDKAVGAFFTYAALKGSFGVAFNWFRDEHEAAFGTSSD